MKSEAKLQARVIKYLRDNEYFVIKTQGGSPGTPIGTPDVITIAPDGQFTGLEFKRPDGKGIVSPEQKAMGVKITRNGGQYFIIDSWKQFEGVWTNIGF